MFKYGIPLLIVDFKTNKYYSVMEAATLKLIQFNSNEDKAFIAFDKNRSEIIAICAFNPDGFSNDIKINDIDKSYFAELIINYNEVINNNLTIKVTKEIAEYALNTWYPKEIKETKNKKIKEPIIIRNVTPNDLDKYLEKRQAFYPLGFNYRTPLNKPNKFELNSKKQEITPFYSNEINETKPVLNTSVILENIKTKKNKTLIASIITYFKSIKLNLVRSVMLKDYYDKYLLEDNLKIKEQLLKWIINNLFESEEYSKFYIIEDNKIIINTDFQNLMERYLW